MFGVLTNLIGWGLIINLIVSIIAFIIDGKAAKETNSRRNAAISTWFIVSIVLFVIAAGLCALLLLLTIAIVSSM